MEPQECFKSQFARARVSVSVSFERARAVKRAVERAREKKRKACDREAGPIILSPDRNPFLLASPLIFIRLYPYLALMVLLVRERDMS